MIRWNSILAAGERGADALKSYVHLQWIFFYAIIIFAFVSMVSVFVYLLSRLFGKIRFNKRQERLHRELRAQIEERDELLQQSEKRQQHLRIKLSNIQDRVDLLDNKLYRVDALNETVNKLESSTEDIVSKAKKKAKKKAIKTSKRSMRKSPVKKD